MLSNNINPNPRLSVRAQFQVASRNAAREVCEKASKPTEFLNRYEDLKSKK